MTGLNIAKNNHFMTAAEMALYEMDKTDSISPIIAFELEFLGEYGAYSNNQIIEDCGTDCTVTDDDIERELNCDYCSREYCPDCCCDCDDYIEPDIDGHEWTTKPMTVAFMLKNRDAFDELSTHIIGSANGYVNENCGGHMHISNVSDAQIARLIQYLASSTNDDLESDFGRTPNNWCKVSSLQFAQMQMHLLNNCTPSFDFKSLTPTYDACDIVAAYRDTQDSRYCALNILELGTQANNHIEFRLPSGTVSSDELYNRVLTLINILNGTQYTSTCALQTALNGDANNALKIGAKERLENLNDALISTENIKRNLENDIAEMQALINSTITTIQPYIK